MAFSTGEIIATPTAEQPFEVVFTTAGEVVDRWPVSSLLEGERQIAVVLRSLRKLAEDEGFV